MSVEDDVQRLEDKVEGMGRTVAVTESRTDTILTEMRDFRKGMHSEASKGQVEIHALGKIMASIDAAFEAHKKEDDKRFADVKSDSAMTARRSAGLVTACGGIIIGILEFLGHTPK